MRGWLTAHARFLASNAPAGSRNTEQTALSTSRRLRTAALVLGVYLIVVWAPASGLLWKALDFYPEKTPLGRLHQRAVKELLN